MSGFRGGGGGGLHHMNRNNNYSVDTPLIKLVEDYLFQYKHLSFINLEHMGEVIRKKSFRYSRMKQSTFKEQLRKAYEQYSETASRTQDEFSGADIVLDNTPLTEETLRAMEGYPSESDSDLEIDESATTALAKDAGVNQMKNLYMAATSANEVACSSKQEHKAPDGTSGGAAALLEKTPNQSFSNNADAVTDCISVGSSTDLSTKSENNNKTKSITALQGNVPTSQNVVVADVRNESEESDVEIIDEVQNERSHNSVITNGFGRSSLTSRAVSQETQQAQVSTPIKSPTGKNEARSPNENNKTKTRIDSLNVEPQATKKVDSTGRGVKRKASSTNENELGINDDLTRKRPKKEVAIIHDTGYKFRDFAGSDKVVEEVCRLLLHLIHPEVYQTIGVTPPRGFLLHGPPGTGKTLLANAIAGELKTPMLKIAGTELVSGISGESESNIRELFNQAVAIAPCIVFIDEIDSVTPRRENVNKEMERRIVAQLLSCIDDLVNKEKGNQVLLIGATNRIEAIDTALRRAGRFDREICLGIPDEKSREKILSVICRNLKLEPGFEIGKLARLTPGYVGADLQALIREAAVQAVNRKLLLQTMKDGCNTSNDTATAMEVDGEPANANASSQVKQNTEVTTQESGTGEPVQGTEIPSKESGTDEPVQSTEIPSKEPASGEPVQITEIPSKESVSGEPEQGTEIPVNKASVADEGEDLQCMEIPGEGTKADSTQDTGISSENQKQSSSEVQDPNPMRWIEETAPLSEVELQDLFVTMKDFTFALKNVQPSSKREGFATVPDTTWEDIGALQDIRDELQVSILGPVKHAEAFQKLGLTTPAGVLLCGPPGCGKTLLAKAVANEAGINFISVKGPELLNMYVGESERAVRQCFLRARNSSPCVIFFDELDALCPRRSDVADGGSSGRIVNQLLTEMDGIESRQGVYVMAASNRPDIIDPAVLRPGRLDKILFVNLPTATERFEILKTITKNSKKPRLDEDVNLEEIANCPECEDYTGADLAALIREASIASFRELVLHAEDSKNSGSSNELKVYRRHFTIAFTKTKPSVGKDDRAKYKKMAERYSSIR